MTVHQEPERKTPSKRMKLQRVSTSGRSLTRQLLFRDTEVTLSVATVWMEWWKSAGSGPFSARWLSSLVLSCPVQLPSCYTCKQSYTPKSQRLQFIRELQRRKKAGRQHCVDVLPCSPEGFIFSHRISFGNFFHFRNVLHLWNFFNWLSSLCVFFMGQLDVNHFHLLQQRWFWMLLVSNVLNRNAKEGNSAL